jgi:hypothetical protein
VPVDHLRAAALRPSSVLRPPSSDPTPSPLGPPASSPANPAVAPNGPSAGEEALAREATATVPPTPVLAPEMPAAALRPASQLPAPSSLLAAPQPTPTQTVVNPALAEALTAKLNSALGQPGMTPDALRAASKWVESDSTLVRLLNKVIG